MPDSGDRSSTDGLVAGSPTYFMAPSTCSSVAHRFVGLLTGFVLRDVTRVGETVRVSSRRPPELIEGHAR